MTSPSLSLPEDKNCPNTAAAGTIECKFWGLGGDGTVGANKNSIKIIGDHTDKYVQAYFQYDSKKTGGVTISHLRFGDKPIKSPYYINKADFVACHNPSYITKGFKMVQDVKPGGVFMINCQWDVDELDHHLNADAKRYIAKNNIQLYTINAIDLAIEIGMGKRTNTILQSAFFSLAKVMPEEEAIQYMKEAATQSYLKKGQDVVEMNHKAIDAGATAYMKIDVPAAWANAEDDAAEHDLEGKPELVKQVKDILDPGGQDGRRQPARFRLRAITWTASSSWALPLMRSAASPSPFPPGTAAKCIQCNNCAYVCPHATIRPFALTEEEAKPTLPRPPRSSTSRPARARAFTSSPWPSPRWTAWAAASASAVPRRRADHGPQESELAQQDVFDYCVSKVSEKKDMQDTTVKGSQFKQPMLEFSGSCAGCAETSYARLVTQLFGDRMMHLQRHRLLVHLGRPRRYLSVHVNKETARVPHGQLPVRGQRRARPRYVPRSEEDPRGSRRQDPRADRCRERRVPTRKPLRRSSSTPMTARPTRAKAYVAAEERRHRRRAGPVPQLLSAAELKAKGGSLRLRRLRAPPRSSTRRTTSPRSPCWIFGGDGWAYDIGYGGLDHVIASERGRQRLRLRYRGLLQHRRTGVQGFQHRSGRTVRGCR